MTIGYVLDDTLDKADGVQQAVISIGEHMRSQGHDVHYIVPETSRTDMQNIHSIAKVINLKFNGNSTRTPLPARRKTIKQLFDDIDFDVLHVQMPYSPFLASRVIKLAKPGVTIVGTFHILPYNFMAKIGTRLLGAWLFKNKYMIDKYYAVSEPALEFMKKSFKVDGKVLPNPVNYNFYHKYSTTKRDPNKKKLVFVGRFDERKGVKQLVSAYERLDPEIREKTELTMCGKGPLRNKLMISSNAKNLDIAFPGFVTDEEKAKLLAEADVAVFPSIGGESFGIVLTEAMAAGAGITLGGSNPGYSSVMQNWPETLFRPLKTNEFTEKLAQFLTDDKKRLEIGKKQHIEVKRYNIEEVAKTLLEEAYIRTD